MAQRASDGPRVRVAALMVIDGRVVFVRHRAGSRTYHLLPGGGVDYRQTLEEALVREISEETGLEAEIGRLLFVNDTIDPAGSRHVVNLTFEARIVGGAVTNRPEDPRVECVDLIASDAIASLDLRPPLQAEILNVLEHPDAPTVYLGSIFSDEHPRASTCTDSRAEGK